MSLFDKLLPIAATVAGGFIGGPVGAAIGGGLATTATTGDIGQGLMAGAMGYAGSSALGALGGSASEAAATQAANEVAKDSIVKAGLNSGAGFLGSGVPGAAMSPVAAAVEHGPWEAFKGAMLNPKIGIPVAIGGLGLVDAMMTPDAPSGSGGPAPIPGRTTLNPRVPMSVPRAGYNAGRDPEHRYFADGGQVKDEKPQMSAPVYNAPPASYRPGFDPQWNYFKDPVPLAPVAGPAPGDPAATPVLTPAEEDPVRFYNFLRGGGGGGGGMSAGRGGGGGGLGFGSNAGLTGLGVGGGSSLGRGPGGTGGMNTGLSGMGMSQPAQRGAFGGMDRVFADGGHVQGPGGPRSDMIPAMLSNGEYVLPAHFVAATGGGPAWDARVVSATGQPTATSGGLGAL